MRKKIVILSAAVAVLIILGVLSPTICSVDVEILQKNETLMVEVNRYYGDNFEPIYTEVSYEQAEEIKEILISLNEAIENNDEEAISKYETILNEKGIFGNNYQEFYSKKTFAEKMNFSRYSGLLKYMEGRNGDNISNNLCYFNAIGQGLILFNLELKLWGAIVRAVENASSPLAGLIIFLALLPFFALVLLLTHLIPFRILMPAGAFSFQNGSISSIGLMGYKKVVVGPDPIDVNVSWFSGLTINFPISENPFLFISGIALEVKESDL